MSSLLYQITEKVLWIAGVKKIFAGEGDELYRKIEKMSKKRSFKIPSSISKHYDFETIKIEDNPCFVIGKKGIKPQKAVLYLFGGGYVLPPDAGDLKLAEKISEETDAQVWLPMYPLAPKHKLIDSVKMTAGVYKKMLEKFVPEKISFVGFSSGASLACTICVYIKEKGIKIPMPRRMILFSPGMQIPPSEIQMENMKKLSDKDPMIEPSFLKNIAPLLAEKKDEYLLSPVLYDWTGFPDIIIYYGTHEVMSAFLPSVKKVSEKAGINLIVHEGEGMMHCWPMLGFTKEGRKSREELFKEIMSM